MVGVVLVSCVLTLLFGVSNTSAQSVIRTGDESSSVVIENSVNSTSNSTSTTTSESHVRVETNGEVVEFHSTGEDINYRSDDGSVNVNIQNNGTENTNTEQEPENTTKEVNTNDSSDTKPLEEQIQGSGVLGAEEKSNPFETEVTKPEVLPTNDILLSIVSVLPTPFGQVQKLFTLLQSAIYLI